MRSPSDDPAPLRWLAVAGIAMAIASAAHGGPTERAALVGTYELTGVREAASALRLRADGRFDYYLAYGALDEVASGVWRVEAGSVVLDSDRPITPPSFELSARSKVAAPVLLVTVVGPNGAPISPIDVEVGFDKGEPATGNTTQQGFELPLERGRRVTSVRLGIGVYGLASQPFPVDTNRANALTFIFRPNDLGKVDFRSAVLRTDGRDLVMTRNGRTMHYMRAAGDE